MARGHEPLRTCVGCRSIGTTAGMVRAVRTPEGEVLIDATRRAPGRGAWVHPNPRCVEAALARGALAKAMRAGVGPQTAGRLRELSTEEQEHE